MEPDLADQIRDRTGKKHVIAGFDDYRHVELEFRIRLSGNSDIHTIWIDPSWVERVT